MEATSKSTVLRAEFQSEELGRITGVLEAACWELDTCLSNLRKDAVGYRTRNAANLDGGENYTPGELEAATVRAAALLRALQPAVELAATWDREAGECRFYVPTDRATSKGFIRGILARHIFGRI